MIKTMKIEGTRLLIHGESTGDTVIEVGSGRKLGEIINDIGTPLRNIIFAENNHDRHKGPLHDAIVERVATLHGDRPNAEIAERLDSCEISRSGKGDLSFKVKAYGESLSDAVTLASSGAVKAQSSLGYIKSFIDGTPPPPEGEPPA